MCGACGIKVDWAGPVVAGPLRRRDIARCMTAVCPTVTVDAMSRGWMVRGRTGVTTPASTLDELCDALVPHVRLAGWAQLEEVLLTVPAPLRIDAPEGEWACPSMIPEGATPVLGAVTHLPGHMMLAAFTLGVRSFASAATVVTTIDPGHHLAARGGHLLGI